MTVAGRSPPDAPSRPDARQTARLFAANLVMLLVLLAYCWPAAAIWFAAIVLGGFAALNLYRLFRG